MSAKKTTGIPNPEEENKTVSGESPEQTGRDPADELTEKEQKIIKQTKTKEEFRKLSKNLQLKHMRNMLNNSVIVKRKDWERLTVVNYGSKNITDDDMFFIFNNLTFRWAPKDAVLCIELKGHKEAIMMGVRHMAHLQSFISTIFNEIQAYSSMKHHSLANEMMKKQSEMMDNVNQSEEWKKNKKKDEENDDDIIDPNMEIPDGY